MRVSRYFGEALRAALIASIACGAASALADEARSAESGKQVHASELQSGEHLVLDGRLNEAAWERAQAYPLRYKFAPTTIDAAVPQTTFRVLVDGEFLYIGVDCRDPSPKEIRQELSHRDLVEGADSVKVWIDPSGRRKFAQIFKVAAGGAIWDGTHYEDSGKDDKSPDFAFEAHSHVDDGGWTAEYKIPASSLRLNGKGRPTILVTRYYPRAIGFVFASTDIDSRHNCILCKNPELVGIANMKRGGAVTVTPYVSATKSAGDFGNALKGRAGVDVKWRLNDSSVVDLSVKPDFSQVELDTPQLSANATYALFFPEKRPFFLEGLDLFDTPMKAVYTRTFTRPDWGARITNRGDGNESMALVTRDVGGGLVLLPGPWTTNTADQPIATAALARSRFHVLGGQVGVVAAMKDYGDLGSNIIGGGDAVYSTANNRFNVQALFSQTSALPSGSGFMRGEAQDDDAQYAAWKHDSSKWHARAILQRVGNRFRDDSGFVEASGLYMGEFFAGRDVRPIFGWDEVLPYVYANHRETLNNETISTDFGTGISIEGGAGSHFETLFFPRSERRVDTLHELHRFSFIETVFNFAPASWMPGIEGVIDLGHRLDTLSDRVGSGYSVQLTPTFLIRTRLRIGGTVAQEYIAADDQVGERRILLRDSVLAINASYFFDPDNELRTTYQHHETYRDPAAFTQIVAEHADSDIVSLIYTWTPSLGKAFYVGGTWVSSSDPTVRSEGAEFFVKVSWAF